MICLLGSKSASIEFIRCFLRFTNLLGQRKDKRMFVSQFFPILNEKMIGNASQLLENLEKDRKSWQLNYLIKPR